MVRDGCYVAGQSGFLAVIMLSGAPIPLKCKLEQTGLGLEQKYLQALSVGGKAGLLL